MSPSVDDTGWKYLYQFFFVNVEVKSALIPSGWGTFNQDHQDFTQPREFKNSLEFKNPKMVEFEIWRLALDQRQVAAHIVL